MASDGAHGWYLPTLVAIALSAVLVGVGLMSFSLEDGRIHIKRVDLPPEIRRCSTDKDCILLKQIGCCPCESGGARGAINPSQRDEWRRFIKRTCRYRAVCVGVKSCRYDLVPACVEGRCVAMVSHG